MWFLPVFSSATPVIATPSSKRKHPLESGHSFGFSNKKRRSVKKNLGIELLPNTLFSGTSTPGSGIDDHLIKWASTILLSLKLVVKLTCFFPLYLLAYSASGVLDSSQNVFSSAGKSRRQSATSVRRKSRRLSNRHAVNRYTLSLLQLSFKIHGYVICLLGRYNRSAATWHLQYGAVTDIHWIKRIKSCRAIKCER